MKIAFTTNGGEWDSAMNPRFGRTEYFLVYNEETEDLTVFDNRETAAGAHGSGPNAARKLYDLEPDILITGNGPGDNASAVLQKMGIRVYAGAQDMTAREAYRKYQAGELSEFKMN